MAYNYTRVDGERVEVSVAAAFARLRDEFRRVWGLDLLVSSGTRTRAEQADLYAAYRAGRGNLAAPPGQSNHEENGPIGPRALDLRDSGGDPGVTRAGTARSNWLRANAPRFGFDPAGFRFSQVESWHYERVGALTGVGDQPLNPAAALDVDGQMGRNTVAKLQQALGVTVDGELGPVTIKALQARVGANQDGDWGPATTRALQARLGVDQDGQLGPQTVSALQRHLNDGGVLAAPVQAGQPVGHVDEDGQLGPQTVTRMQQSLGMPEKECDGQWGPTTTGWLQRAVGVPDDGQLGPQTIKALQTVAGVTVDGDMGPETIRGLQRFLNAGAQWRKVEVTPEAPVPDATARPAVYPGAARAWLVPLSGNRDLPVKVTKLVIHHTTNVNSEEAFFKTKNSRSSCPTWYVMTDGTVVELISPDKRPSATQGANNDSVAIEIQNTSGAPAYTVSAAALESVAQIAAWVSQRTDVFGVPFEVTLDREHVVGHNQAGTLATACPGPYVTPRLDSIVERAKEIVAAQQPQQGSTVSVDADVIKAVKAAVAKLPEA